MNKRVLIHFVAVSIALFVVVLPSYATDDWEQKSPTILASGNNFAIHQFEGFVENRMVESVIRSGVVISHINLETGVMKWLVSTGIHSIPTRRISYSLTRLVGLMQDDRHLLVVVYSSGRTFTQNNRPPLCPDPKKGQYVLQVFSKAEGKKVYSWTFKDSGLFPESVPSETTESGIIRKVKKGYRVFDSVFRIDESGKVIREHGTSQGSSGQT